VADAQRAGFLVHVRPAQALDLRTAQTTPEHSMAQEFLKNDASGPKQAFRNGQHRPTT
jgi:hypothetical protein